MGGPTATGTDSGWRCARGGPAVRASCRIVHEASEPPKLYFLKEGRWAWAPTQRHIPDVRC